MEYNTHIPHPNLTALIKCHWELKIPTSHDHEKQRILPDGCVELIFNLGDDIKRFTGITEFIYQPRAFILGQITEPFFIQPTGDVSTFATKFYPYGLSHFIKKPMVNLMNKETALSDIFDSSVVTTLYGLLFNATNTLDRIKVIENYLFSLLHHPDNILRIVSETVDLLINTQGSISIKKILNDLPTTRRNLERKFASQIGLSPKQLGKMIRMQTALRFITTHPHKSLTDIAYESAYYDQAHFIKDMKEFTGRTPKAFLQDNSLLLSALFATK